MQTFCLSICLASLGAQGSERPVQFSPLMVALHAPMTGSGLSADGGQKLFLPSGTLQSLSCVVDFIFSRFPTSSLEPC